MTNTILQLFLDNRFIKTDDPEHIEHLRKASSAVQKLLQQKKYRPKIISYTLAALDPIISDDDPVIKEVEALIIKNWTTFRNSVAKTKDVPITYIQAVILEALNKLSVDENYAALIWHTGCNIISYYKLAGQEEILQNFLLDIGRKVEENGRINWSILENAKTDTVDLIEFELPKFTQGKISVDELSGHLIAAAVHSAWATQAGGGENPFTTVQNNFNWPKFFAERAAKGLSEVINDALSTQNKTLDSLSVSVKDAIDRYLSSLNVHLERVSNSVLQSAKSINKRSELLWWKQTLYSPRLDSSYRKLDPLPLVLAMAVDLADFVSPIHPRSVDYFLVETLRDVKSDVTDSKVTIAGLLVQIQKLSDNERKLLPDLIYDNEGRKPLGACLADIVNGSITADQFFERTGLDNNTQVSWGELVVWLFHDLQANILVKI